jgi:diaminopimelate decarboxylase
MQLIDNEYRIQNLPVLDICHEFDTPLYVYDADRIVEQLNKLQKAFEGVPLKIKYAAKALTNISVLKVLKNAGAGVDVVSIQEVHVSLYAGFKPEEIMFTPNSVAFGEIQEAVQLGVGINIDNLSILEQFGKTYGNTVPCALRLNPHIVAGGNAKIQVGHINSKFGISVSQLAQIHCIVDQYHIRVNGLHIHTGSDIKQVSAFMQSAEILLEAAMNFPHLEFINFGSGFKVAYHHDDHITNITDLGTQLKKAFLEFCDRYGKKLEIWFEPGKFLVSEAGYFFVKTNVLKQAPNTLFVGVDSGLNHLIRPMMYDAYHDMVNVSNPSGETKTHTVVGYICETDTFGADRSLAEVREGDIIAIKNAGAYGFSMSSNYNSRFRPAEVLVYKGKAHLIRKRETMEDILKNQIVPESLV